MGVDLINHRFAPELSPGWVHLVYCFPRCMGLRRFIPRNMPSFSSRIAFMNEFREVNFPMKSSTYHSL